MLKVDANAMSSKSWSKVQALTSFIQLKSNSSSPPTNNKNDNHVPFVSHSNTGNQEQETQEQPIPDRLKVFIGTWNMYGRLLDIDLEPFLTTRHPSTPSRTSPADTISQPDNDKKLVEHDKQDGESPFLASSTAHPYHLLAIGTQECERDISESLLFPSKEAWEERLCEYLDDQYKMVRCETLAALHLAVFVNKNFSGYVKNIHSADIKTGWANLVGNKGAVAVSLDFGSQSLLFINCHLRAHQGNTSERNANVCRILHELQIKGGKLAHDPSPSSSSSSSKNALFHLPSLKRLTHPVSTKSTKSIKSPGSLKAINKEKISPKEKTPKNPKPLLTLNDNNLPITDENTKPHNQSDNEGIITNNSTKKDELSTQNVTTNTNQQYLSDKIDHPEKTSSNVPVEAKPSTSTSKKSNKSTSKLRNKENDDNNGNSKRKSLSAMSTSSSLTSTSTSTSTSTEEQRSVTEQFDHVFIFGDTNYRISADRQFVLDTIKKQDFKTLLKYDQLTLERQQNTTPLANFNEHPINFIPTYKFDTIDAISTDSSSSASSSSTSLPIPLATTNSKQQEDQITSSPPPLSSSSSSTSSESSPAKPTIPSSSESFTITPKNSLHHCGSVTVQYDTSPKQRIPSWTDRILWHDRHHTHHHHHNQQQQQQGDPTPQSNLSRSIPSANAATTTVTATNQSQQMKPKKNLKWINAIKRKDKNGLTDKGLTGAPLVDKNTICYHYDTVMDPRLMGVSDHLPVIGIFGIWFNEWENGTSKKAKSIKSFKKKVPLWKKWLLQ